MSGNPYEREGKIQVEPWDKIHYEAVCTLTINKSVSHDEVLEFMVPALCGIGLLEAGNTCRMTIAENMLVISRPVSHIDLEVDDKAN